MIKCVVFDIGGVLIVDDAALLCDRLNTRLGKKVFVQRSGMDATLERGDMNVQEFYKWLRRKHRIPAAKLERLMRTEYLRTFVVHKDVMALAKDLQRKWYKTAILSNMRESSKNFNRKRGLFRHFSYVVLSCDVGHIKPQKQIYHIFLHRAKTEPEECVFIDDKKENLVYPKKLGMKTIHFRNAVQLKRDLRKLGVKV